MAGTSRARLQEPRPPDKADQHASAAKQTASLSKTTSKLPSPAVAAEILDAAQRTTRTPLTPAPTRPKIAPAPLSSEKSAARPKTAPPVPAPPAVAVQQPLPPVTRSPQPVPGEARTRTTPVLTLVPKPAAAGAPAQAAAAPPQAGLRTPAPAAPPAAAAPPAMAQAPGATPAAAPPATAAKGEVASPEAAPAAPAEGGKEAGKEEAAKSEKGKEPEKGAGKAAGKEAKGAAVGEAAAEEEAGGAGAGGPAVKLHMPEPPTEPSPATKKRIHGVKARAGASATSHAALPPGGSQVADARQAVTEPDAEAKAKAQADLIAMLDEKPAPSPEIVKLCERIRDVIRNKRPPDEDALMEAKPEGEALNAGNQLNSTVEGETKKVQDNYGSLNNPPAGAAPQKGQDLPPQPDAAATPGVNAKAATPDAVPPGNVSLDKDAADSKKKMQDAGMDTPAAQLVQSGPVADARGAQGELEQAAKEDPAKVLADQKATLAKAEGDMTALQQQALAALTKSRATTVKGATAQQHGMVGSEESMRAKASADAQQIFTDTQTQVEALLKPVASNAIAEWEAAKDVLVSNFKADLAPVQKRVDERHAGASGFVVGLWDAVTGLPSWAEEGYTKAEKNFGDGVIAKLTEISVKVNSVIATCEALIKDARQRISKIFSELPGSLQAWAAGEQAKFDGKLDQLHNQAIAARDSFNKDLVERSSAAVDEVRSEIAELRKKAGGLVGRIVAAVNRFLDDPVKFIIEGLLELLGIPPASFWAVVAKIKKVIKDIADDPMKFANNLLAGLAQGFSQFFDNILEHLLKGFISWLTGSLGDVGVQLPKDASLKSIITFFLQLMGITWPRIRKVLAKHVGEKNVALLEKVYSLVSFLIEKGPEGIFEMIKEMLDPQNIVDQVVNLAVDYIITAVVKAVSVRIIMLFNPAGAILQALEAIYKVLKWIFQNAARIFTLIETVVNGVADILAGNIGGFANAVEKGLEMLIAPVISFIADYLGFGDLPDKIAKKIKEFQDWVMSLIEKALVFIIEKGKALLAAVGIGGKKDKEKKDDKEGPGTVGEEVEFEAGGESHRIWIEAHGDNAVVMVASTEEALEGFLKGKRVKDAIKKDKSGQLSGLVSQALGVLKNSDVDADTVLKEMHKIQKENEAEAGGAEAEVTQKNDKVKEEEHELAQLLVKIFELVGGGLKIVEVLGTEIDPLTTEPDGYEFWTPGLPKPFKEIRRQSGYGGKGKEYPRVSVDENGLIVADIKPHRYDSDLVKRYDAAIEAAEKKQPLDGSPDTPPANLKGLWLIETSASDPRLRGHRQAMEAIIEVVNHGPGTLTGVEVNLPTGVRADYVVLEGTIQRLVEVKAWSKMDLTAGRKAARDFRAQIKGYVDEAQSRGKQAGGAVHLFRVHIQFRTEPQDREEAIELAEHEVELARRRRPPVILTYEGL